MTLRGHAVEQAAVDAADLDHQAAVLGVLAG